MLYNHPIYISFCIKVFTHGVVKTALPYYLKMPAVHIKKNTFKKGVKEMIVMVRQFSLKDHSFLLAAF